jgi:YHS domain-containing protein
MYHSISKSIIFSAVCLTLFCGFNGVTVGQDLAGVKCVVNGEAAASPDVFAEYKGAKVYFASDKELGSFKAAMKQNVDTYKMRANHQLVLTSQFGQKACPITGKPVAKGKTVDVFGVTVGFCCGGCVGKINKIEAVGEKVTMVFGDEAFARGFELKANEVNLADVKCLVKPGKGVDESTAVEWNGHKVYFCCNGCKSKFENDPTKFTTQANFQLVASGQVKQIACPFSGGDLAEDQSTEVAGISVKYCCKNCKAKMESSNAAQQLEFVFGKKGFEKGFVTGTEKE